MGGLVAGQAVVSSTGGNIAGDGSDLLATAVKEVADCLLRASSVLDTAALDKYSFTRDLYLNRRQSQIDDLIDKGIGLGGRDQ